MSSLLQATTRFRSLRKWSDRWYQQDDRARILSLHLNRLESKLLSSDSRLVINAVNEILDHWPTSIPVGDLYPPLEDVIPAWDDTRLYMNRLSWSSKSSKVYEYLYRCLATTEECQGWYIIMDTLTIDQTLVTNVQEVLSYSGWATYKSQFKERIRQAAGLSQKVPIHEYCKYFGTVEGGKRGKNPHVHVLWWCRSIPDSWKVDPNRGRRRPYRREIDAAKGLWPYGISTPTAVRTSSADAWGCLGWSWPLGKDGKPLKTLGTRGVACYISKYLTKENHIPWKSRVRGTRGLGTSYIRNFLARMPQRLLRPLSQITFPDRWSDLRLKVQIPPRLLRSMARSTRLSRLWDKKSSLMARWNIRRPTLNLFGNLRELWPEIGERLERSASWTESDKTLLQIPTPGSDRRYDSAFALLLSSFPAPPRGPTVRGLVGRRYATL